MSTFWRFRQMEGTPLQQLRQKIINSPLCLKHSMAGEARPTGASRRAMDKGAAAMDELREKAKFCKISSAGMRESHVHDVIITKEAPNYRLD